MTNKPPLTFAEVPPEWIEMVRTMLTRDGMPARGHADRPTIQVKSLTTNQWMPLMLPNSGFLFANYGERNEVLRAITEGAK